MTDNNGLPEAGWHDDPEDSAQLRYWDGTAWTEHRSPKVATAQPSAAHATPVQPSNTTAMSHDANAPAKSGAPWWLVAVLSVVSLVIGIGIGFGIGAVASGEDDAVAATTTSADASPEATTGATTDPTTSDAEPTDDAAGSGGAGTASDPLAIDVPWTYDTSWFGEDATKWEGSFEGLVTLPVDEFDDDEGARCFAIVGTMAPTAIADGAFTNNVFDTPDFQVVVGGSVQDDFGFCDYDALEAAGYGQVLDAEVSVGTQYKFFDVVYLPSTVQGDVELIVLGSASDEGALFYEPTPTIIG